MMKGSHSSVAFSPIEKIKTNLGNPYGRGLPLWQHWPPWEPQRNCSCLSRSPRKVKLSKWSHKRSLNWPACASHIDTPWTLQQWGRALKSQSAWDWHLLQLIDENGTLVWWYAQWLDHLPNWGTSTHSPCFHSPQNLAWRTCDKLLIKGFWILIHQPCCLHVDTHSGKDDGKVVIVVVKDAFAWQLDQWALPTDLSRNLVVRKPVGREDGDLLPTSNWVHHVYGRDASLHHFLRVNPEDRI